MRDIVQLQRMVDDLRAMRDKCEPKEAANKRYNSYSRAVSSINWIISDLQAEEVSDRRVLMPENMAAEHGYVPMLTSDDV